jgi:putative transposase
MRPARKRQMVDEVRVVWRVSIRRACQALPVDRSTYHYRSKRTGQAVLIKRIREIAETRVRYGYRRIHVLLRREADLPPIWWTPLLSSGGSGKVSNEPGTATFYG